MMRDVLTLDALRRLPPEEAAARWAARQCGADMSGPEKAQFEEWLALEPTHRLAWAKAQASLNAFDQAGDDDLLEALRAHARAAQPERSFEWRRLAAAVVGIGVLASITLLGSQRAWLSPPPAPNHTGAPAPDPLTVFGQADFVTGKGEQRRIRLADGSLAMLDTGSALDLAFTKSRRSIALLKGRIFFDVAHDAGRPFAVAAGARDIVALGTRFDVRLVDNHVRVNLVEGRLSIAPRGATITPTLLHTGQRFEDIGGAGKVTTPASMAEIADWQRGYLTFADSTLADAATEFNRYGGAQLVVRDPRVARLRVSGLFRAADAGRFARTMAVIHPVKVINRPPDAIEIQPAG